MHDSDANEEVSAFVDGELRGPARARIVGRLYGDFELRRAWERFHLIGDAVRKVGPVPGAGSIAGKVVGAISGERIVPPTPRARRFGVGPLSGLVLAASVAAVAVLGIRGLDGGSAQRPAAEVPEHKVAAGPAVSVPDPVVPDPARPGTATAVRHPRSEAARLQWNDATPDAEARLNLYLVNHNEYAGHGVQGVLPYVRVVGYRSGAGG